MKSVMSDQDDVPLNANAGCPGTGSQQAGSYLLIHLVFAPFYHISWENRHDTVIEDQGIGLLIPHSHRVNPVLFTSQFLSTSVKV